MEQKPQPPQTQPQTHQQQQQQQQHQHQKNILPTSKSNNNNNNNNLTSNKKQIWDCGSTLYDSFELNSFQKQLDSAIITSSSSRTLSMPRLPSDDYRAPPQSKKPVPSKLSRTFQKLLRSVFRAPKSNHQPKPNYDNISNSPDPWFMDPLDDHIQEKDKVVDSGRYFVVYEKPNGLSTIPEVPEVGFSPDIRSSLVRKTMSDRFSVASNGIFCV